MTKDSVAERLKRYIGDEPGKRMSIRRFSELMQARQPKPRGSTRTMIHLYLRDDSSTPRIEFLEAAAAILDVSPEWLRSGKGQPTPLLTAAATATRTAEIFVQTKPLSGRGPDDTLEHLKVIGPPLADFPAALAMFVSVWDRCVAITSTPNTPKARYQLAERLWEHVVAPLQLLRIAPEDAPEAYFTTTLSAYMSAVPGVGRPAVAPTSARRMR